MHGTLSNAEFQQVIQGERLQWAMEEPNDHQPLCPTCGEQVQEMACVNEQCEQFGNVVVFESGLVDVH